MWMGDLEISIINEIYDCVLLVFEITNNYNTLNLINIYGKDDTDDKSILNLCYVNNNHYIVLYEPDRKVNIKSEIKWNDISYLNKNYNNINLEKQKDNKIYNKNNLIYANDNRLIKYNNIITYIKKVKLMLIIDTPNIYTI